MRLLHSLAMLAAMAFFMPAAAMAQAPAEAGEAVGPPPIYSAEIDQAGPPGLVRSGASGGPAPDPGSVVEAGEGLEAGEFVWAPEAAPAGPVLLVVSLAAQRAAVYRNGVAIGISTVSSGRSGTPTPTGTFTVLERDAVHHSNRYDNAPMPHMLRLTWDGIALHGGDVPGYPASHGCIRLPRKFARLLYGVTRIGTTVIVTDESIEARVASAEGVLRAP
ncbi:MAG TPA: L,D-transpeptidase family protein [Allosphingosinicella sp.]